MIKKVSIFLAIAMTIAVLTACNSNIPGRTTIKDGDKTITIIEPRATAENDELRVEKIDEYKDIRALDWQNEDRLLVSKKNTNVNKISSEGEVFYPNNLYIFDIISGEYRILKEESANQLFAEFSPDKKHIFYKTNSEETARGYVMDSQGQNAVSVTGDKTMYVMAGKWVDNERVIYPDFGNGIYEGDISGKIVEVVNLGSESANYAFRNGNDIYYLTSGLELKKYNLDSKVTDTLDENVFKIFPSGDMSKLAYVKMTKDEKVELIMADMDFNKKTLAEGMAISQAAWSPDNTRLVFSITKEASEESGIYLSDFKSGETSRISLFDEVIGFSWSPSGKKISVCRFDKDYNIWSNIITLNK
ncbi:TolB family protein [Acetivibrio clariflavus]|uniref:TolB protein n=1 Tax=Acetivibrio clariflavus (strain DSM 19732 / NBRC 101661 / EBR45) TaxID=720554 RepID=G8LVM1_ACECE|nr:PD40 domain-containing protein [Acetivibrio clariflavus]AEV69657.1 hypothetical protein Clocl_3130 [Acetivibrio clariflavus DSM 19732]HOQ01267.1 PD40 domain-containing protein [Acetivibrio clariflavus]HPU41018.1 PD40 domain-containing protein [Acetivibrio clariflavus]